VPAAAVRVDHDAGYVIEASNLKFRFYTNDARIETSPGVPYELTHPYSLFEFNKLDYFQSNDVLYLAGAGQQPQKLMRTGATTFAIAPLELDNGPMDPGNSDETATVTVSSTTGTPVITASSAIFAAGDVGGLFEIEAKDFHDIPSWEPGITVEYLEKRTWAGRVYQCATNPGTRTGTLPPEHDQGIEWDGSGSGTDINAKGPYGVQWQFLYGRIGLARIDTYISPTTVSSTVLKRFADSLVSTGSWLWAFGAFSDKRGWPDTVGGWNDCLVLTKGNKGYTSVIGDSRISPPRQLGRLPARPRRAVHLAQAGDDQLAGVGPLSAARHRDRRIYGRAGANPDRHAGPAGVRYPAAKLERLEKDQADPGRRADAVPAARGRKLARWAMRSARTATSRPDMTRLADHIGAGFVELAWQAEPERLVWAVLGDGSLAAMTYDPEQQVMGWCAPRARRRLLKRVSHCRITDPDGQARPNLDRRGCGRRTSSCAWRKSWEYGDDQKAGVHGRRRAQLFGRAGDDVQRPRSP
jgi:hypothetical protein